MTVLKRSSMVLGAAAMAGLIAYGVAQATAANAANGLPDLVVQKITVGPNKITPGGALDVQAFIRNKGTSVAPGTVGSGGGSGGFMVDITLGTDHDTPDGFAAGSPNYSEDVLLKGGRFSNTTDLAPGETKDFSDFDPEIPADTPLGNYFVCARVDPGQKVAESKEDNNTKCTRIKVVQ